MKEDKNKKEKWMMLTKKKTIYLKSHTVLPKKLVPTERKSHIVLPKKLVLTKRKSHTGAP